MVSNQKEIPRSHSPRVGALNHHAAATGGSNSKKELPSSAAQQPPPLPPKPNDKDAPKDHHSWFKWSNKKGTNPQQDPLQNQDRTLDPHNHQQTHQPNQQFSSQNVQHLQPSPQDIWRNATEHYEPQIQHLKISYDDLKSDFDLLKQRHNEALLRETQHKETISQLTQDLRETQADHAHLRKHLQLGDPEESGQIVNEFKGINRAVEDVARFIAEETLKQWSFEKPEPTTADAHNFEDLRAIIPQSNVMPSILMSNMKDPRPLEDVLDYGLRSIVSKVFDEEIYSPFHPSLAAFRGEDGARRSSYLKDLYFLTCLQGEHIKLQSKYC